MDRIIVRGAFLLCLLILTACGKSGSSGLSEVPSAAALPPAGPQDSAALPGFPDPHSALAMQQHVLRGRDSFSFRGGELGETTIELEAVDGLAWAQYGFGPIDGFATNLLVLLDVPAGSEVWVALADHQRGRWEFNGPFGASTALSLDPERHMALSGAVYAAVVLEPGNSATVNALSLNAEDHLNSPPQAALQLDPASGTAPFSTVLSAAGSSDDKGIVLYLWDFNGDGGYEETSTLPSAAHQYTEPGQYLATLLVLDSEGLSDSDFVLVTVNAAPQARLTAQPAPEVWPGDTLQLDGSASTDSDGEIVSYAWELDGDGDFNDEGGNKASFPYIVLEEPGFLDIALRVTDDFGAEDTAELRITVRGTGGGAVGPGAPVAGIISSMIVVGGLPMIAHVGGDGDLRFIRGQDSGPSAWIAFADDLSTEPGIRSLSLRLINGKPAVAFSAAQTSEQFPPYTLKYVIAADSLGESWQPPVDLEIEGWVSPDSLRTVRGWPGIAYWDAQDNALYFVRPQDANGNSWAEPFLVSAENYASTISLLVVDGRPAIAAYRPVSGDNHLFYLHSSDEFGINWPAGITVDGSSDGSALPSLSLINGRPAISYRRITGERLMYVRAQDAAGEAWGQPLDLAQLGGTIKESRLSLVAGLPAIAFAGEGGAVHIMQAQDSGGLNWDSARHVAAANTAGPSISLAELDGQPAISLRAVNNELQFYREF